MSLTLSDLLQHGVTSNDRARLGVDDLPVDAALAVVLDYAVENGVTDFRAACRATGVA